MYHFIEGTLCSAPRGYAVLNVGGVGYQIFISERTAGELSHLGKDTRCRLYTYLNVREDAMELFGFLTEAEKEAFLLLTSVSGVGARGAMSILSALTVEKLSFAILSDDAKAISSANGIGTKTAQKIILELKDKLAKDPTFAPAAGDAFGAPKSEEVGGALAEAVRARGVLGYPRAHVLKQAAKLKDRNLSVEELIRALLQTLGGQ